jgi:hypothetical protein
MLTRSDRIRRRRRMNRQIQELLIQRRLSTVAAPPAEPARSAEPAGTA